MKRLVVFFLFLCIYLVGGCDDVQANAYTGNTCFSSSISFQKILQAENAANHNFFFSRDKDVSGENKDLVSLENEDEEDAFKKYLFPTSYFSAFLYALVLSFICIRIASSIPRHRYLSYIGARKYIAQRVIRI